MDNKSAIEATLKFLSDNVKAFAYEEPRECGKGLATTFSYQNDAGNVRNGRVRIGKLTYGSRHNNVSIEFNSARKFEAKAAYCWVRKQIPFSGDIKFDKKTKERLEAVVSFIEYTYEQEMLITQQENASRDFKASMTDSLSKIGVNITFGTASERLSGTSTEIEVKDRVAKFTALTDDVELLRKLREVCENHTRSN